MELRGFFGFFIWGEFDVYCIWLDVVCISLYNGEIFFSELFDIVWLIFEFVVLDVELEILD